MALKVHKVQLVLQVLQDFKVCKVRQDLLVFLALKELKV
jgi:hypothetical protein